MTLQLRRDTAANWTSVNPTLAAGQPGYETDTGRVKIGDGSTAWTSLAYRFESAGGVSDGDKGDITVSSSGTVWTIDAGAVTVSKMANLAASTILGNNTGGAAAPTALSAAQVKTLLAIAASDVSGLATIATSGSASDLGAGTLPAARFDDTAHGSRAGGALHANVVAAGAAGFMTGADKTKLDAISGTNTGDVTLAGTPSYLTIVGQVITRALIDLASHVTGKLPFANIADMATGTLFYRKTAGSGAPETQTLATLKTDLGLTGTNSGDQTTIVGITGTKAQFDTAVTDGNFLYVGDAPTAHTHTASEVTDFAEAVDDRVAALVVAGTNMTVTYNDAAGTLTFDAAGGGAGTNLSYTAATRIIASDTGTDATLPLVTTGDAGLAPATGGGTSNFLRADGTWALLEDYTTTVTSGTTVTLTASSKDVQVFTGSTSQTVALPVVSTLTLGRTFRIRNASTSTVTVQSSGGNTINSTIGSNMDATYTCVALTGTDATSWLSRIDGASGRTGSGSATFNSSPTFTGTPIFPASVTGGASLRVPHGVAPSAPVDGDLWTTTTSVFAQVNGVTVDLAAAGGGATNLSYTAATRVIASDTGTDATLPLVTTGDAGLAPASGGGTTNFLRADGTWAAPSGGGGGAPQIMSWMI